MPAHLPEPDLDQVCSILQHLGYETTPADPKRPTIGVVIGGYHCHILAYPAGDLQIVAGFERDRHPFGLGRINDLNFLHRFAKLVVDSEGGLLVLMDISLAHIPPEAMEPFLSECLMTLGGVLDEIVEDLVSEPANAT